MFRKPEIIPLLFIIAATALLTSLGVWQLVRLERKEAMIARIEAAQALPPLTTLPTDLADLEFRSVSLKGRFTEMPSFRAAGGKQGVGPGFFILTPFILPDGRAILVNRGFLPNDQAAAAPPPRVEGVLRAPRGHRLFVPDNQPEKNIWLHEDLAAMSKQAAVTLLPLVIEATGERETGHYPIPHHGKITLYNNHLGYAITWFSLALIGLLMFVIYNNRRPRPVRGPEAMGEVERGTLDPRMRGDDN